MLSCTTCEAELGADQRFCSSCGAPAPAAAPDEPTRRRAVPLLATMQAAPPAPPPFAPPAAPPGAPPAARSFDPAVLLRGNWLGAAAVAAIGLVVLVVLSVAQMLAVAWHSGASAGERTRLTASLAARSFGASTTIGLGPEGGGTSSTHSVPILVVLLVMVPSALCLRMLTARHPSPWPAVLDAARAALFLALGVTVLSVVGRGGDVDERTGYATHPLAAFGSTLVVVLVVLLLAVAARRRWAGTEVAPWCWSTARSVLWFAVTVPLAGVLALVVQIRQGSYAGSGGGSGGATSAYVTAVDRALLLNVDATGVVGAGSGSRVGIFGTGEEYPEGRSRLHGLTQLDGLWWAAIPLVALVVLGAAAFLVVGLRGRPVSRVLLGAGVWLVAMVAASAAYLWFLSVRQSATYQGEELHTSYGAQPGLTVLLLAGAFAVAGLVALGVTALTAPRPPARRRPSTRRGA